MGELEVNSLILPTIGGDLVALVQALLGGFFRHGAALVRV